MFSVVLPSDEAKIKDYPTHVFVEKINEIDIKKMRDKFHETTYINENMNEIERKRSKRSLILSRICPQQTFFVRLCVYQTPPVLILCIASITLLFTQKIDK